ncbi:acyl carrier protein [Streptosporangium nondiastaticum]|uniref:Acyl carrier protein n=1 Tax=Streptosporangium nondiastaticum TaxID=35764 RepID=A0A9X7JSN1_9ACTN|nr:acyl carrier protein [Streptosporangium nondiastaticum]PSJ29134.1 acyl carrier protein [Streptosporangium nondiastaticum]
MPETYDLLRSILTSNFRIPENEIQPQVTLEQLGVDSLALAELSLIIHERFGMKVDRESATRNATIAEIVDHLDALSTDMPVPS